MSSDPNPAPPSAPQNIYDDASFFEGYRTLRQGDTGLNGALEFPAMKRLLPDLAGLHVLDLGCGFGDFARYARTHGAASVTAVDVSSRMLDEARARTDDEAITYLQRSIETYHAATRAFDLVVSSLALHYVEDYAGVVARIYDALRSNAASCSRSSIRSAPRIRTAGCATTTATSSTGPSIAIGRRGGATRAGSSTASSNTTGRSRPM